MDNALFDDRDRALRLPRAPRRIVSLVPSDTLNVASLGCAERLIACTDYCELPAAVTASLPKLGGTKNPRVSEILALKPDLVLANQEENSRGDLQKLAAAGVPVWIAFPKTVAQGLAQLARLARLLSVAQEPTTRALIARGYAALREAEQHAQQAAVRSFCPIWMQPLMTIHGSTYISDMMRLCGLHNVFAARERRYPLSADLGQGEAKPAPGRDVRYPRVRVDEVLARAPELVLLPSEPHPFSAEDRATIASWEPARSWRLLDVDGKDLCWYGARAIDGLSRLRAQIQAALS